MKKTGLTLLLLTAAIIEGALSGNLYFSTLFGPSDVQIPGYIRFVLSFAPGGLFMFAVLAVYWYTARTAGLIRKTIVSVATMILGCICFFAAQWITLHITDVVKEWPTWQAAVGGLAGSVLMMMVLKFLLRPYSWRSVFLLSAAGGILGGVCMSTAPIIVKLFNVQLIDVDIYRPTFIVFFIGWQGIMTVLLSLPILVQAQRESTPSVAQI